MTMAPSASNGRLRRLAWLPVPLLLFAMAVLWVADPGAVYEPPHLLIGVNLLFSMPGALLVAYQAGRGFLLGGNLGLLGVGCGMLYWGSAGPVGGILIPYGPGVVVAAHNMLIWLAAASHVAGMTLARRQRTAVRWPELWLAGTYVGAMTLGAIIVLEAVSGEIPPFFIQGQGGTPLRQFVLASAIVMFVLTAILLKKNRLGTPSTFQDWYALALLLVAVGLFGVMIQSAVGSALGWTGRIAQNLGGVYLLVAAVIELREARDRGHPLEITLGEAKQRFEELINLAADGIVLHERMGETAPGNFLQVNPALCALLGYTAQEMRELTPLDILAPEDRERIAGDSRAMDRDGSLRHEKTLIARDGRRIPVEISTRQYPHQGRAMVISVIRDITERKRVEAALRENEQFQQAVLDAVTAHVAVLDREGRIVAVNQPWRRFALENSGSTDRSAPNTDIGANYLDICRAADGEWTEGALEAHDGIKAVLAGKAMTFSLEYPCHSPREKRWFSLTVTPLAGRGGGVVSHIDITALRELADQLRNERDRFTRIVATVPGVICSFRLRPDGGTCFPYASPAIEDLYGLRPEALVESAAPLWAMIHPDDLGHIDVGITASARAMTPWRDEFRLRHPLKGEIWVEGHSTPVREPDGGILWHGYVQDITERKRAEAALRALLEEKEVLLREVHHRVKNNLAAIIDLLELQRGNVADAPMSSLLAELGHRIHSMALVHEMLYQSGNLSRVDFHGYLQALVGHLRDSLDPHGAIQLGVTVPEIGMNLDTAIPCGLIVNELVTNALKYAFPERRPRPGAEACEIVVAVDWDGATYTLTITDNGIGLPAALDWTTTRTLGLRLVRMLGQHQLRGRIELDGAGGTRFSLRFNPR
ncbi:MAG: PAS domain S-box protein [Candidatus Competibacter sp.]|nr:PAS domain S-box protein [Candidatus Competibacter sp.]